MEAVVKVSGYTLAMQSSHELSQQQRVEESLRMWADRPAPAQPPAQQVNLSPAAREKHASEAAAMGDAERNAQNDPKLQLLILMLEKLTGQKVRVFDASQLKSVQAPEMPDQPPSSAGSPPVPSPRTGFGVAYDRTEIYSESEQTTLQASGIIKTSDGQEIRFSLDLVMQRQYSETSSTRIRLGDAARKTDPLVINFGGTAAQLSEQRFAFDLNSDGTNEQINAPLPGSGFLALDLNGDGRINNGSELFGPATGNGFGELAQYDSDRNGWIDESDDVYRQLKVWTKDTAGNDNLSSLATLAIGALSLQALETPFDIKTASNQLLGSVRTTSIYLNENGTAGSVQQVDLTI